MAMSIDLRLSCAFIAELHDAPVVTPLKARAVKHPSKTGTT
jgi:hypothetical protein